MMSKAVEIAKSDKSRLTTREVNLLRTYIVDQLQKHNNRNRKYSESKKQRELENQTNTPVQSN